MLIFLLTVIGGIILHFMYHVFPNSIIALFSPVRESIWEHVKIIYWPFGAAALWLTCGDKQYTGTAWRLSLSFICIAMLGIGFWYHILLVKDSVIFDIGLYIVLIAVGFYLPKFFHSFSHKTLWTVVSWIMVGLFFILIWQFTYNPPETPLFTDLSAVRTWVTHPL